MKKDLVLFYKEKYLIKLEKDFGTIAHSKTCVNIIHNNNKKRTQIS